METWTTKGGGLCDKGVVVKDYFRRCETLRFMGTMKELYRGGYRGRGRGSCYLARVPRDTKEPTST